MGKRVKAKIRDAVTTVIDQFPHAKVWDIADVLQELRDIMLQGMARVDELERRGMR